MKNTKTPTTPKSTTAAAMPDMRRAYLRELRDIKRENAKIVRAYHRAARDGQRELTRIERDAQRQMQSAALTLSRTHSGLDKQSRILERRRAIIEARLS